MTNKKREEKKRRQEMILRTHQSTGRPMDSVEPDPDASRFERFDIYDELPPLSEKPVKRFPLKWAILYALFIVSVLIFILFMDAPYREQRAQKESQAAAALGEVMPGESVPIHKVSGKVARVASNNDDYPPVERRKVMRNIFPSRYLTLNGSAERYYLPVWLTFLLSDNELRNAGNIVVEYDARPKIGSLMFGKAYTYYSVTTLTVDGKTYFSPTTTYGIEDSVIWLLLVGGLCIVFVFVWRRSNTDS